MKRKNTHIFLAYLFIVGCFIFALEQTFAESFDAKPLSSSLIVKGHLGNGYIPTARMSGIVNQLIDQKNRMVDTVLAIPVFKAGLNGQNIVNGVTSPVDADGLFRLALSKDKDYVLVLINSGTKTPSKFVGQIVLPIEASSAPLLFLPAEKLIDATLNLDDIEAEGDLAVPAHIIKNKEWSLTPAQLAVLAANDSNFNNIKNLVINYSADSGIFYTLRPDFYWEGFYSGMRSGISFPMMYSHYNFQLDSNSTEVTMDMICGANSVPKAALELFPPAGITISTKYPPLIYDAYTPIANNNVACSMTSEGFIEARDEDFFATNRYGNISYTFGYSLLTDPIPGGYWQYRVNNAFRAQFDEGVTTPKTPDGMVNGLIPAIHANLEANGRINSFTVTWYQLDESSPMKYSEITDLSVLSNLVDSAEIFLQNNATGQSRYEGIPYDPVTQTTISTVKDWYYGTSGTSYTQAESIGTFHSSAGIGYFFEYPRIVFPVGDPQCKLPIPDYEIALVKNGQQYQPSIHDGLDFGFTDWPEISGQYVLRNIVAPVSGQVTEINGHFITGTPTSSNNYAYTVVIRYNEGWSTFVCFEPDTQDQTLVDLQKQMLTVTLGQMVNQGEIIGQLVVSKPSSSVVFGPHVHWQLYRTDDNGQSTEIVCPRTYSTQDAIVTLDSLYESLGISQPCAVP